MLSCAATLGRLCGNARTRPALTTAQPGSLSRLTPRRDADTDVGSLLAFVEKLPATTTDGGGKRPRITATAGPPHTTAITHAGGPPNRFETSHESQGDTRLEADLFGPSWSATSLPEGWRGAAI
jgi:hypothetical protein